MVMKNFLFLLSLILLFSYSITTIIILRKMVVENLTAQKKHQKNSALY